MVGMMVDLGSARGQHSCTLDSTSSTFYQPGICLPSRLRTFLSRAELQKKRQRHVRDYFLLALQALNKKLERSSSVC